MSTVVEKLIIGQVKPAEPFKQFLQKQTQVWWEFNKNRGDIVTFNWAVFVLVDNPNSHNYAVGKPMAMVKFLGTRRYWNPWGGDNNLPGVRRSYRPATDEEIDEFIKRMMAHMVA